MKIYIHIKGSTKVKNEKRAWIILENRNKENNNNNNFIKPKGNKFQKI